MIRTETILDRFFTMEAAEASLKESGYQAYPSDDHETHYRHPSTMLAGLRGETPYCPEWRVVRKQMDGQFAVIRVVNRHWRDFAGSQA